MQEALQSPLITLMSGGIPLHLTITPWVDICYNRGKTADSGGSCRQDGVF
jgi:hypothetical protein